MAARFSNLLRSVVDRLLTHSFLQAEKINPIHGVSAEHYQGEGFVQSPPAEKS